MVSHFALCAIFQPKTWSGRVFDVPPRRGAAEAGHGRFIVPPSAGPSEPKGTAVSARQSRPAKAEQ